MTERQWEEQAWGHTWEPAFATGTYKAPVGRDPGEGLPGDETLIPDPRTTEDRPALVPVRGRWFDRLAAWLDRLLCRLFNV